MTAVVDPSGIVKAYDIRGVVPDQLDATVARRVGAAFADVVARHGAGADAAREAAVIVGHDMRTSSPELARAVADGIRGAGRDVDFAGLASTDEVYFGSGSRQAPAVVVTASHNPRQYNGLKLCLPGAVALSHETGLAEIATALSRAEPARPETSRGRLREIDLLASYAEHVRTLAPLRGRRLTVVVDAANAMAGHTVPAVLGPLDVEVVPLYFELDGTFPHHPPDPLQPDNLRDVSAETVRRRADLGLAFDGDADRCFVVDERGRPVSPSVITCLIAVRELARTPGATVIHNAITSRAVAETVRAHGGVPLRTPVGHSLIKAEMARSGAVFGGEHSGHYYFRDFFNADSGMLAALHVMGMVAAGERSLSELAASYGGYVASGELNSRVEDPQRVIEDVQWRFSDRDDVCLDHLDGLSVLAADWWFNLRASNTEPLLRLNVEARDDATMIAVRDSVLAMVRRTS